MWRFYDFSPERQPDGELSTEKSKRLIREAFKTGGCVADWIHNSSDGTLIPTEVTLVRVKYFGRFVVAGFARDLREQKLMLEKLNAALEQAQAASQAKSDFLSNMSHEIRTPINAIIGMTEIGKTAPGVEKKNYAFGKIEGASSHLLGVVNDILDMSKIEAGKFELSDVEFNFKKMLQNVVNIISFRIKEKKQNFTLDFDPKIPQRLIGDDQRLSQVITNLLSNAVKFTPDNGSISLKVEFMEEKEGLCILKCNVTDTGIGISRNQKARLFHSFQQAEVGISRKFGGTGLGLSISKRIIELMGGNIWLESKQGHGSTFIFTVALRYGRNDIDDTDDDNDNKRDEHYDFSGLNILLAEDIEINREILLTILEPTNITVECAEDGVRALAKFTEAPEKYDIIFMDVQMPQMDGFEATRRIRAIEEKLRSPSETPGKNLKQVPIIAMTANVFREDIEKCLEAGMNSHIGKPIDFDKLFAILKAYLKKDISVFL